MLQAPPSPAVFADSKLRRTLLIPLFHPRRSRYPEGHMGIGSTSATLSAALLVIAGFVGSAHAQPPEKAGPLLRERATRATGWSEVIVQGTDPAAMQEIAPVIARLGGVGGRPLAIIDGIVVTLPNAAIAALASHP